MRCVLLLMLLCVSAACQSTESKPNIVIILSDDQAWNDYSFMGHKHIKTPNIDKLAAESVLFKRGYVPTAFCRSIELTKSKTSENAEIQQNTTPPETNMTICKHFLTSILAVASLTNGLQADYATEVFPYALEHENPETFSFQQASLIPSL